MEAAVETFLSFLRDEGVTTPVVGSASLQESVEVNFDFLNESRLRALVTRALAERDKLASRGTDANSLLGTWGHVIDVVKETTQSRTDRARMFLQKLVSEGMEGDQKDVVRMVNKAQKSGAIDRIFKSMLADTIEEANAAKQEEISAVLGFVQHVIQMKESVASQSSDLYLDGGANDEKEKQHQQRFVRAGIRLKVMMEQCAGDAKTLKEKALEGVSNGTIDEDFVKVLDDNISACRDAHFVNKVKLFEFLRGIVKNGLESKDSPLDGAGLEDIAEGSTTHHAPAFIDENHNEEQTPNINYSFSAPEKFIELDAKSEALFLKDKSSGAKKALKRKENKKKTSILAKSIGAHLKEHEWAVCDNFLPLDLIRRVRIEAGIFQECYENSEIWVGKQADVGAHIQVPSVRGDKVLWMCGGHRAAPEGVTRHVKTKGEIEPCKLDVKAKAPMRKFAAMKELITAIDKLVDELKLNVDSLSGIYERSDAMLANYPGNGSRFARHIDNTTGDGRRLTVLVYLNPDWTPEQGGALRLTPTPNPDRGSSSSEQQTRTSSLKEKEPLELDVSSDGTFDLSEMEITVSPIPDAQAVNGDLEAKVVDVFPNAGRLAMFFSSSMPHEVMPSYGDRHALTVWYYDTKERVAALEDAQKSGRSGIASSSSIESQKEAKEFIADLMGGDEVDSDGGDISTQDLANLGTRVSELSDETLGIVSGITGAPSVESFREGFPLLGKEDIKNMRKLFRRMGLQD
jgi:Rps23 Pro-64 3,4-dihydroxylase Tpa1-like proline 4-hydroxylase